MNSEQLRTKALALKHFLAVDQKLHAQAQRQLPTIDLPTALPPPDRPAVLMKSIVSQQISTAAANSIWQRLQPELFDSNNRLTNPGFDVLATKGATANKAKALVALSQALTSRQLDLGAFDGWTDARVIEHLVQYPGIGPWTAEMFLISGLGRPDVFSLRDLGLRTALSRLHGLPAEIDQLEPLAKSYSPHGTLAALVCWQSLNNGDLDAGA